MMMVDWRRPATFLKWLYLAPLWLSPHLLAMRWMMAILFLFSSPWGHANTCSKNIYLTFDTGNMQVAQYVAKVLREHNVRATFFLANEKTFRQDFALDDSWQEFWQGLVKEGHYFGSHTLYHTYWQKDIDAKQVMIKSQFGPDAGKLVKTNQASYCQSLQAVDRRFFALTGSHLQKIWRAPGGKTSPTLLQFGQACGFKHIAWSKAGFLGDELSSESHPNSVLLDKALTHLRDQDITMAHLGIWSRKDPWAPAVLEPLIKGLKDKGFCFKRIGEPT